MAKRKSGWLKRSVPRSKKTKKRLEAKKAMLAAKSSTRKKK